MDRPTAARKPTPFLVPHSNWSDETAAHLSEAERLLYRSNLLGADLAVTNFGGGNTSAKIREREPVSGKEIEVLWVKGSGGDLGSVRLDGFATLYLEKVRALEKLYASKADEDAMASLLPHCTFGLNPRAASIDTPLHAFLPFAHVDHVHPDALIALAASSKGERATEEIFEGRVGWLGWRRPGFDLALRIRDLVRQHKGLQGIILAGHGVICWADNAKDCYLNTLDLIGRAAGWLNEQQSGKPAFGGERLVAHPRSERAALAARILLKLRTQIDRFTVGHFDDSDAVLEFVCSKDAARLASIGTSCPDHFLRTKIHPLVVDPSWVSDDGSSALAKAFEDYRVSYRAYYERCREADTPPLRDPNPVVFLVPEVGLFTLASDKATARVASEFYVNAINVMRGAETVGQYVGLPEKEAFGIEYWKLEEAKLRRQPKPKPLAGRVALITGGAGGIGSACARRLLAEGACVVLVDRSEERLASMSEALSEAFSADVVRSRLCDVTDENEVESAFDFAAREYGGVDILIANAGIASSAPVTETSVKMWRENYAVLVDAYFMAARAAFPLMAAKGGSIVFIGSKNALAATPNAAAYSSAKAAAVHLARCLALEGAPQGIRVNVVNPDAVIRGSQIWGSSWREERARAYGVNAGAELETFYKERSLLKREVLPEDIAEAVLFFASDLSAKSTGNILNVDAGNAQAFTR